MFTFKAAAGAVERRISVFFTGILARRAIAPLLYANDRMLRDIGLSHADIVDSLSGQICVDPSKLLIARINERREGLRDIPASLARLRKTADAAAAPADASSRSLAA